MNWSLNRFLLVVFGLKPTIYALSVIERERAAADRSSNGFARPIYDFCVSRVPYPTPRGLDTLHDGVRRYTMMICCYAMNVHSNSYQTTVESTYRFLRSDAACNGNLHSSTQSCELTVPPPTTPTVVEPYMLLVIKHMRTNANRSSNGFAPTIYALLVIKRMRTDANRSSNGFAPPTYNFCHYSRVPYSMLCGQDMLRDKV